MEVATAGVRAASAVCATEICSTNLKIGFCLYFQQICAQPFYTEMCHKVSEFCEMKLPVYRKRLQLQPFGLDHPVGIKPEAGGCLVTLSGLQQCVDVDLPVSAKLNITFCLG